LRANTLHHDQHLKEKVYDEFSKSEQEQVRDIFLRLTRLDEGNEGRDTRRRVLLSDLIPARANAASISILLDKLANARLIVKTVNGWMQSCYLKFIES
jgi:hypothetical protein